MNLYLISQDENNNYDTYDSAIVCAESESEARLIHPSNDPPTKLMGNDFDTWDYQYRSWCSHPDKVSVKLIGIADNRIKKGVVLTSFNAG